MVSDFDFRNLFFWSAFFNRAWPFTNIDWQFFFNIEISVSGSVRIVGLKCTCLCASLAASSRASLRALVIVMSGQWRCKSHEDGRLARHRESLFSRTLVFEGSVFMVLTILKARNSCDLCVVIDNLDGRQMWISRGREGVGNRGSWLGDRVSACRFRLVARRQPSSRRGEMFVVHVPGWRPAGCWWWEKERENDGLRKATAPRQLWISKAIGSGGSFGLFCALTKFHEEIREWFEKSIHKS